MLRIARLSRRIPTAGNVEFIRFGPGGRSRDLLGMEIVGEDDQVTQRRVDRLHVLALACIDPRHIPANKLPPPVHIEQITADRKTYATASNLESGIVDLEIANQRR